LAQFYEQWLDNDYNPFVLFDLSGKIVMINQEAQYLLPQVGAKELFDMASAYASMTFGFKTTLFDFRLGENQYYGITVGYLDDNNIGIKFYKKHVKRFVSFDESGEFVNIYSLLDLCISAASISRKIVFKKDFDPTFPELKLHIEKFTQLVSKLFEIYQNSSSIKIKLAVKTGEYIKFNDKRYPIFLLSIEGAERDAKKEHTIEQLAQGINCVVYFKSKETVVYSPMICA
jgi:nitrogen-specific signal transduction histidine kinase